MSVVAELRAARALIDSPEKWTQGAFARRADSEHACSIRDVGATRFCAAGAVVRAGGGGDATAALREATGHFGGLYAWNDAPERTHAEVLAVFDRAIAARS